jgi:hypothetical protein
MKENDYYNETNYPVRSRQKNKSCKDGAKGETFGRRALDDNKRDGRSGQQGKENG